MRSVGRNFGRWLTRSTCRRRFGPATQPRRKSTVSEPLPRRLASEGIGSFFLFATVIGSGVMAEALAGGNVAIALLGNTLATGAILFVLITMLGPVSGAHFNPAVSLVMAARGELRGRRAALHRRPACVGLLGALAAHLMFDLPILQFSVRARGGIGQWTGELVATFGLILTILGTLSIGPAGFLPGWGSTSLPPTGLRPRPASPIRQSRSSGASATASRASRRGCTGLYRRATGRRATRRARRTLAVRQARARNGLRQRRVSSSEENPNAHDQAPRQ